MSELTHINADGRLSMVDVAGKAVSERSAIAAARVRMSAASLRQVLRHGSAKGDVFAAARIAGIQAAKRTGELIPLCHPLALDHVDVDFDVDAEGGVIDIVARCRVTARTGVEMEAMTAASVAALTIYDMCKAIERGIVIDGVRLLEKRGGRSGLWRAEDDA